MNASHKWSPSSINPTYQRNLLKGRGSVFLFFFLLQHTRSLSNLFQLVSNSKKLARYQQYWPIYKVFLFFPGASWNDFVTCNFVIPRITKVKGIIIFCKQHSAAINMLGFLKKTKYDRRDPPSTLHLKKKKSAMPICPHIDLWIFVWI